MNNIMDDVNTITSRTESLPKKTESLVDQYIKTPSKSIFLHLSSILFLVRHFPPSKKESVVILSIPITFAVDKSSILPSILKVFIWKRCIFGLLGHYKI